MSFHSHSFSSVWGLYLKCLCWVGFGDVQVFLHLIRAVTSRHLHFNLYEIQRKWQPPPSLQLQLQLETHGAHKPNKRHVGMDEQEGLNYSGSKWLGNTKRLQNYSALNQGKLTPSINISKILNKKYSLMLITKLWMEWRWIWNPEW